MNKSVKEIIDHNRILIEQIKEKNEVIFRYREELEFYADEESWSLYDHHGRTLIGIDGGMRARKVLEGEE